MATLRLVNVVQRTLLRRARTCDGLAAVTVPYVEDPELVLAKYAMLLRWLDRLFELNVVQAPP